MPCLRTPTKSTAWPGTCGIWRCAAPSTRHWVSTRSHIFHALDPLRDLRNRVSHHEAVWDRKLDRSHQNILETIAWINRDLATTLQEHSPLPEVLDRGVAGFRAQAEAMIK